MNKMSEETKMRPMIVLPPDDMDADNLKMLRDNGICVVVSKNPSALKFVDPIPCLAQRSKIEDAAIKLSRKILNPGPYTPETRANLAAMYVEILMKGTPLDPHPTKEEVEKRIFDEAKAEEIKKLAREEARSERLAAKQKKA